MKILSKLIIGAALLGTFAAATPAQADWYYYHHHHHHHHHYHGGVSVIVR